MTELTPRASRTVRDLAERLARVERAQRRDSRTQPTRRSPVTADAATGEPALGGEASAPVVLGVPAAPAVDAVGELLAVHLTGLDAQGERAPAGVVARVHTSLEEGFTVSEGTVAQSVHPAGTVPVAVLAAGVWHVRVEWVLGGQSTVSDAVTVDVEPLVDTADLEQALATAQDRLDAVKAALGALSGPLTPMLAGVLPDTEGRVYYQKDEAGEIVSAWQVVNGAWVQQPLESAVLVRVTTDQIVAGMGLIGGTLIENGAVTAEHITASESMSAKLAQFLKVTAGMIQSNAFEGQTFTGGTFTGAIFQSHAAAETGMKLNQGGMVLYDRIQSADGSWAAWPALEFGTNGQFGMRSTNSAGETLWQVDRAGSASFVDLAVERDPTVAGRALAGDYAEYESPAMEGATDGSLLDPLPRGVVAGPILRNVAPFTESQVAERSFLEASFTVQPGRAYRVSLAPITVYSPTSRRIFVRLRHSDGAPCAIDSPLMAQFTTETSGVDVNQISASWPFYRGVSEPEVKKYVMVSVASDQPWTIDSGTFNLIVEDIGPAAPGSGGDRNAAGRLFTGTNPPSEPDPTAPAKVRRTAGWNADWSRSWYAGGSSVQTTGSGASQIRQGLDSHATHIGAQTGMWGYTTGSDVNTTGVSLASVAGAGIVEAKLYVRAIYGLGGTTIRLHWHGNTSAPATYSNSSSAANYVGDYRIPVGSGLTITLPKSVRDAIRNGQLKGFSLNPRGSSSDAYVVGLSTNPQLTVTYER